MKVLCSAMSITLFLVAAMSLAAQDTAKNDGEAILICFPEYAVESSKDKPVYGLGHAGVLLIARNGLTKYYEYGRYDAEQIGQVRQLPKGVPNVKIKDGLATPESLQVVLEDISKRAGKGGSIRAAYFIDMDFDAMNALASRMLNESDKKHKSYDANRVAYDARKNNCGLFAEKIVLAGNELVDKPTIINPTPINVIDEYIEEKNAEITYDTKAKKISIGTGDESDAKLERDKSK